MSHWSFRVRAKVTIKLKSSVINIKYEVIEQISYIIAYTRSSEACIQISFIVKRMLNNIHFSLPKNIIKLAYTFIFYLSLSLLVLLKLVLQLLKCLLIQYPTCKQRSYNYTLRGYTVGDRLTTACLLTPCLLSIPYRHASAYCQ